MRDVTALFSMTVEEYLQFEQTSPTRHEYVAGELYAMTGATARHNTLAANVFTRLFEAARDGTCRAFMSDRRVQAADDRHYYPDVVVPEYWVVDVNRYHGVTPRPRSLRSG